MSRRGKTLFKLIVAAALLVFTFIGWIKLKNLYTEAENSPVRQKGMAYSTWSKNGYMSFSSNESIEKLAETGCEWVALVTTWYQDKYNSTDIRPTRQTPSNGSLIYIIDKMHELGMKVMLKPHLDIIDSSEGWRGDIDFASEDDWQTWFDSYSDFILHYAKMAQEKGVEMFCIGTELTNPALVKGNLWRKKIIEPIRAIYTGKLTYAANWYEEYNSVNFWDTLDYAGVDAYFPLSEDKDKPSVEDLKKAWEPWVEDIEAWQTRINKPVIFPEIGYKSSTGTHKRPWEHMPVQEVDLKLQADCYTALLETFWEKDWFFGIYWWHWSTSPQAGGELNRGFTPQNKPAQKVIEAWCSK